MRDNVFRRGTGPSGACRLRPATRHRGASLVEILVSIGILMAAMGILAQYVVMSLDESARAHRRAAAYLLAQERIEAILARRADLDAFAAEAKESFPLDPEPATPLYHFKPARENYRWAWDIEPVEGHPELRDIRVRVHWYQPQGPLFREHCVLRTLVAVPRSETAPSGAGATPREGGAP